MTRTLIAPAFLMFASAASANNPIAYSPGDPPTAHVAIQDVNVRTAEGRVTVERRIERAARLVCADLQNNGSIAQPLKLYDQCYDVALAGGVTQLEQLASE